MKGGLFMPAKGSFVSARFTNTDEMRGSGRRGRLQVCAALLGFAACSLLLFAACGESPGDSGRVPPAEENEASGTERAGFPGGDVGCDGLHEPVCPTRLRRRLRDKKSAVRDSKFPRPCRGP